MSVIYTRQVFDWPSPILDLLGLADRALVRLGVFAVQAARVEVLACWVSRIGLNHCFGPHNSLLLPLHLLVLPECLQLHHLLISRPLSRRGVGEWVFAWSPAVATLLVLDGLSLVPAQQVWDLGAAVSGFVVGEWREVGLLRDCDLSLSGPLGGRAVLNGKSRRQGGILLGWVWIEEDAEILLAVDTLSLAIQMLESPGKVQLLLTTGRDVILGDERAVVELNVTHEGGEMDEVLVAAGAVDVLLLGMILAGCQC